MYNGLIGGIGEGLSSFAQAYQTALNYQLEKQKAANIADYQQQMGMAATQNAATERAKGAAESAKLGQPGLDIFNKSLNPPDQNELSPQALQPTELPSQTVSNPPGFVGPPAPTNLPSQLPAANTPGSLASSGPQSSVFHNILPGKGQDLKSVTQMQNEYDLAKRGIDPQTGQPANNPLGEAYKLEQRKAKAETVASEDMPTQRLTETFQTDPAVKNSNEIATNYTQLKRGYNSKSPTAQEDMFFTLLKMASPGQAVREAPLEDLQKLPTWNQKLEDLYNRAFSGEKSQRTRDDIMRAGAELANGNATNYQDIKQRYSTMAQDRGAKNSFINNQLIEKTGPDSKNMLSNLGPYQPNTPSWAQNMGSKASGLLFGNKSSPAASQVSIQQQAQAEIARRKAASK